MTHNGAAQISPREQMKVLVTCWVKSITRFNFCLIVYAGKAWKRMVTKVTFVGEGFTRKPVKFERFIRPMVSRLWLSMWGVVVVSVGCGC